MALGRPIVASELPGPVEQLGADCGLLVEPADPAALVAAVEVLLTDPERASALGRAAQNRCEQMWDLVQFRERVVDLAAELGSV